MLPTWLKRLAIVVAFYCFMGAVGIGAFTLLSGLFGRGVLAMMLACGFAWWTFAQVVTSPSVRSFLEHYDTDAS